MLKSITMIAVSAALLAPMAAADPVYRHRPAVKAERFDNHLDRLERRGVIQQGSYADKVEDRLDRIEDRIDRRENRRDEAIDFGPRDVREDRLDRLEDRWDRRENRWDRRAG